MWILSLSKMRLKLSIWWKDLFIKLILLYAIVKVVYYLYNILQSFIGISNPLVPDYLPAYLSFPLFFLITLWALIFIMCIICIKSAIRLEKYAIILIVGTVLFQLAEARIFQWLMTINPFGG